MDDGRSSVNSALRAASAASGPFELRWRAMMAGVMVALAAQIVLTIVGAAIGSSLVDVQSLPVVSGPLYPPAPTPQVGIFVACWSMFTVLVACLSGGFVTGTASHGASTRIAMVHGVVVFSIVLLVSVWLVAIGTNAIFSLIGAGAAADPARAVPTVPEHLSLVLRDVNDHGLLNPRHHGPALWTLSGVLFAGALSAVLGSLMGVRATMLRARTVPVTNPPAYAVLRPSQSG